MVKSHVYLAAPVKAPFDSRFLHLFKVLPLIRAYVLYKWVRTQKMVILALTIKKN